MKEVNRALLPEPVCTWVESALDAQITRIRPRAGGGAVRSGAELDLTRGDGAVIRGFLAYDGGQRVFSGVRDKYVREACVLRALEATGIHAPRLLASDPDVRAHLFEFVEGDDRFMKLTDPREAMAVATQFVGELARLHNLNLDELNLDAFGAPLAPAQTIRQRLAELEQEHTAAGPPDPMIVYGLSWLAANIPEYDGPAVLVHGDAGPGNFLFKDGRIQTVLDWELAHFGDPLEDFAWMSIRAIIQAWVPFAPLLKAYQDQSGIAVDLARIRYYRIYTLIGMIVGSHRRFYQEPQKLSDQGRLGNGLMFAMVHRRAYVHGLAEAQGFALPEVQVPDGQPQPTDPFIDSLLGQIRDVIVARTDDQVISETAKDMARVLKYVRARQQMEAHMDADELQDLAAVLKQPLPDLESARAALIEHMPTLDDQVLIEIMWRRVNRETAVLRGTMGALADRLFPPLE